MLANAHGITANGSEEFLYAGLGYELDESQAEAFVKWGLAAYMEDAKDGTPKVNNSASGKPSDSGRSKSIPKSGRLKRGRSNTNNDKRSNKKT